MRLDKAAKKLEQGETVSLKPHGSSMRGRIESGQRIVLAPCSSDEIDVGDAVLAKVRGRWYIHLVKAICQEKNGRKFQIGNNCGGINGWTRKVCGKVIKIGDDE
jgi:hypothetical protein